MQTGARKYTFDVFLSHNSEDKDVIRRVAVQLQNSGIRVWFDEWAIAVGDDVYLSIEAGLEHSRVLALFISKAALRSDWVALERSTALFRDPANRSRRFVPILLDDCNIPDTLRRYRYLDFRHDWDSALTALVQICRCPVESSGLADRDSLFENYRKSHVDLYASLTSGRTILRPKAIGLSGQEVDAEREIAVWLNSFRRSRLAVLGDAGAGKTYLLRRLCSAVAEAGVQIPVFVNAGQLRARRAPPKSLLTLTDPPVPDNCILELANLVVVIDGLDELVGPTQEDQSEYLEALEALAALCPPTAKVLLSCRSTTFEATSGVISKAFGTVQFRGSATDRTDEAISAAIVATGTGELDRIRLLELTASEARTYLSQRVGSDLARAGAASYVLENLPRVPMTLRFLELALPELRPLTGKIELDQLYSVALRAWMLRDPSLTSDDVNSIWKHAQMDEPYDASANLSSSLQNRLVRTGLLTKTPHGRFSWSHFSIAEYFFAIRLFEEFKLYQAHTLARLDLIRQYNLNRFLVPMCRRALPSLADGTPFVSVTVRQYSEFIRATGWRRDSGYGRHPSFIADDDTGFTSGTVNLKPDNAEARTGRADTPICGLSWYDAIEFSKWSGRSLPHSNYPPRTASIQPSLCYWCMDWADEPRAHVALMTIGQDGGVLFPGGANPDFRHKNIALCASLTASERR